MNFTLHIWRQADALSQGRFETYRVEHISPDCSFLEMLDILNGQLVGDSVAHPVCFDNDCREGICGMCGLYINGRPHGNDDGVTTCQLHMRRFSDGDEIWVEPWRAKPFPVVRDLVVDRSAFDKIIQAGGYISATTGGAPDANAILIPKHKADEAMDAAACIGCGACVAACKNASAMLFVAAKVSHLSLLPQGQPEAADRVRRMVSKMDELGFGSCTNTFACEAECPKQIKRQHIARLNRQWIGQAFGRDRK
ncbi:MAG: succinate dehydrogenase iron-sulfur subunit [bacterium P3]|nr:MAG: succinate dehydrogenase iron-sulfur subunit [bacterium P3]KWW41928.1 MAG: Succinate dehydrogenase/fumarate reductase iron-sulfur subunit [bacterium F083]